MSEYLQLIDKKILDRITKIAHWFQRLTGKNNFFLAKVFAWFLASASALAVGNYYYPLLLDKTSITDVFFHTLMTIFALGFAYSCDTQDSLAKTGKKTRSVMRLFYGYWHIRMPIVFFVITILPSSILRVSLTPMAIIQLFVDGHVFYYFLVIYLVCVEPLPPSKSKVKEFLESFSSLGKKVATESSS